MKRKAECCVDLMTCNRGWWSQCFVNTEKSPLNILSDMFRRLLNQIVFFCSLALAGLLKQPGPGEISNCSRCFACYWSEFYQTTLIKDTDYWFYEEGSWVSLAELTRTTVGNLINFWSVKKYISSGWRNFRRGRMTKMTQVVRLLVNGGKGDRSSA